MSLLRRTIQAIGLGRGTTPATDGGKIRSVQMKFPTLGNTADGVPLMQHYGFASRPHASCDYTTVAMAHDPGKTVAVASNDQRYQFPLAEGESAIHDDQVQSVHIQLDGIAWTDKFMNSITSGASGFNFTDKWGNSFVTGAGGVTITSCTGVVTVDNEIAGSSEGGTGASFSGVIKSLQNVIANVGAAQVGLATHTHSDAGGSGNSGPPVPGT